MAWNRRGGMWALASRGGQFEPVLFRRAGRTSAAHHIGKSSLLHDVGECRPKISSPCEADPRGHVSCHELKAVCQSIVE